MSPSAAKQSQIGEAARPCRHSALQPIHSSPDEVELELWQTSSGPHCSEEVPRLLAEYLQEQAERILGIKFGPKLSVGFASHGIFSLHVERTEKEGRKDSKKYFQAVSGEEENIKETDLEISDFNLDCILTNKLEIGALSKK